MEAIAAGRNRSLRVPPMMVAMAIVLMAEAMLFAGMISACLLLRARSPMAWPPADQPRLPVAVTNVNALALVLSAYTLSQVKKDRRYFSGTLGLAVLFLGVQGVEWSRLLLHRSGEATPYTACFYALIGTHALHVVAGVGLLLWARVGEEMRLRVATPYWFFVSLLWPVLYVLVYF